MEHWEKGVWYLNHAWFMASEPWICVTEAQCLAVDYTINNPGMEWSEEPDEGKEKDP